MSRNLMQHCVADMIKESRDESASIGSPVTTKELRILEESVEDNGIKTNGRSTH